ncbi:MAG: class I SAM-dependent methyltransferase [Anaerolineales bacterium]|jgi:23S rRNA (cytosine1962-C5)-methyltransferase
MNKQNPVLILKPGREKSLLRHHPWVFSGAVDTIIGEPESGDIVDIISEKDEFLARGAYSHSSRIIARVWTWNIDEDVNEGFLKSRIQRAISLRDTIISSTDTNAYRLVHAESDGLPGLIVDQYADVVVMQLLSWGVEVCREAITKVLMELTHAKTIYERSDVDSRKLEGLSDRNNLLFGEEIKTEVEIIENGIPFLVDVISGHKTGFYLDQRKNRNLLRGYCSGREVLDCFTYTGGFSINALIGGANNVTAVDESRIAIELARKNLALNNLDQSKIEFIEADVFTQLRTFRDHGKQFDLILLDPPKFAPTRSQVSKASRGYKDINLLALKLLRPEGILFTFSCSGGIDAALFQKIVAGAALDAGVEVQIIERLSQDSDHPVALNFPEGEYLKGLICRKK